MVPSVEIAPSVFMPLLSFGISNHSLFVSLGGRGLDTAFDYGDSAQAEVGAAIRASGLPRSELFVTTKVPCCPSAFVSSSTYSDHCHARRTPEQTAADIAHDLSVLGLTYVDAMLMHWPCDSTEDNIATWRVLESLVFDGRARAIGVSNFNVSALDALMPHVKVKPALNQCGFSIAGHSGILYRNQSWGREDATLARCKQLGITYMAYSPLGGWALGGTSRVLHDPTVQAVAATHNRTAAAVALRFVVQEGAALVTSSDKESHDLDDINSVFNFNLSDAEVAQLAAIR
eukprot:2497770-Prymnesium_polylepis.1